MFFYNIVYCKIQINSFFFSSFLSFYLPLAATIILDFSLRLTYTFCYPSSLPTDFLSFSPYIFFSFSSSLFFLAHSCSLFPSRDTHFHSFTFHALYTISLPLSSLLTFLLLTFISISLHLLSFSHATFSLLRAHLSSSFIYLHFALLSLHSVFAYFSFFVSMLLLTRVADLVAFALSFHPPTAHSIHSGFPLLSLH